MSKTIVLDILKKNLSLTQRDVAIVSYGLKKIRGLIIDSLITVGLGLAFGIMFQSILFQVAFILIRMYAGGYHARTEIACKVQSLVVTIVSIVFIKILCIYSYSVPEVSMMICVFIVMMAPVEAENKPLFKRERIINKIKTTGILVILTGIAWFFREKMQFVVPIITAEYVVYFLMILGMICKNKKVCDNAHR